MKFAGGALHWTEDEFWSCSFAYFRAAYEGWKLAHGVKPAVKPMTRDRYEELKRQVGG